MDPWKILLIHITLIVKMVTIYEMYRGVNAKGEKKRPSNMYLFGVIIKMNYKE